MVHMRLLLVCAGVMLPVLAIGQSVADQVSEHARQLHMRAIVVDTHDDTTQRLLDKSFDIAKRNTTGNIDIPRMREGGLDAIFFSIWMTGDITGPPAVKRALDQIDAVREAVRTHPSELVLATTASEIRQAHAAHKIAALMGVEGGHMIDSDLAVLRTFAALGVRYMTLTHSVNTPWADSSGDKPAHDGLTPFGKDVVREMNRLGIMVDISHVADKTFFDALETTKVPVIASHSSARAIANAPRNMTDDMLRAVTKNGGVVMVNYHAGFLSEEFRVAKPGPALQAKLDAVSKRCGDNEGCSIPATDSLYHEAMLNGEMPKVSWEKIVDHIDHIA
ncbi:MAG TPA: dipeptidase, partial [Vicinamibacterales bacterium]|nr:dipeptidase [Vicinamibacterales bacterium]